MSTDRILAHFAEQAEFCTAYGSPFTGDLITRMCADLEAGGPTAALIGAWSTDPRADALSLRLTGALHYAALTSRDTQLAALYPGRASTWSIDEIWPIARAFLERERAWVAGFIRSAPQTNETRRAITLLAGFLEFGAHWNGPIDMLELGASAGLNLNWDAFQYNAKNWQWGAPSPVVIDTDWNGAPPPITAPLDIRNRAACDLNPLDITDDAQRLQLKSYIWPDQPDRLARFEGAVALAREACVKVERAEAAEWLAGKLARRADDAATIVYHSVFLQYPPQAAREAIIDALHAAGANATPQAPLAWVRLEPEEITDNVKGSPRFVLDLTTWPGPKRRVLAYTDGHVRAVYVA